MELSVTASKKKNKDELDAYETKKKKFVRKNRIKRDASVINKVKINKHGVEMK